MKKRIFSFSLAVLMLFTLLSQVSFAAVSANDIDSALKLADKGEIYVFGNSLPKTVKIGLTDYDVTYESTIPSIIDSSGAVTHGDLFQ